MYIYIYVIHVTVLSSRSNQINIEALRTQLNIYTVCICYIYIHTYIHTYIPAVVHHSYIYIYTYALYDWLFIFTIQTISRSEDFISYVAPQIITVLVIGSALSILTGTLNQIHQVGPKCVKWDSKNDHAMTHYRDINSQYV